MTPQEYRTKLLSLRDAAVSKAVEFILVPNANELLANIKNRIMVDGKNTAGAEIGQYSTKPMYATKEQFVKKSSFKPLGQRGFKGERIVPGAKKGEFKVKKTPPKSMYLEQGYKQLRSIQGRPVDKMNYNYTGDTMLGYQLAAVNNTVLLGMVNEQSSKVRKGLEAKRGKAFYPGSEELAQFKKNIATDTEQFVKSFLNA